MEISSKHIFMYSAPHFFMEWSLSSKTQRVPETEDSPKSHTNSVSFPLYTYDKVKYINEAY